MKLILHDLLVGGIALGFILLIVGASPEKQTRAALKDQAVAAELTADTAIPNGVVVLNFGAYWNESSIALQGQIAKLQNCTPMVVVDQAVFAHYKVRVLPTIVFLSDGDEYFRLEGNVKFELQVDQKELQDAVNKGVESAE